MEKKQYELCFEVLRRFYKAGIMNNFILIGSWCVYFYKDYFKNVPYINEITLRTRDIDFLVNRPRKIEHNVNIPELLGDLGFVTVFKGNEGYIKLDHPDLILEFLVPEKGKGIDKPFTLPKLGINATALRFLSFLAENTIKVKVDNFSITLPHPANFALHKLIICQRRQEADKATKDRDTALEIIKALINKREIGIIKNVFDSVSIKWQRKIVKGLKEAGEKKILEIFE